ncbi:MAG: tyrosine transporter [Chlamydiia bacterium]|nr:tyrosine transporter [Chlamydiia bacterium]MCP5509136.1 tyrosine transporter [Chlamydiales bacterium]
MKDKLKFIGGTLIIGGTALGAGMLALPVVTAAAGFMPSLLIYILCWAFSACTGLLFVEICLWMPQDANIISMASHLLGKWGKAACWLLYIFLFYSLTVAYVAGGGNFTSELLGTPIWLSSIIFTLVFGTCVVMGTKAVDRINFLLMIGLVVSFIAFIALGIGKVKPALAMRFNMWPAFLALPVIFTSFSYQGTVPSIVAYFNRDGNKARKAILLGTAIPFLAYIIWEYLILGIVPLSGTHGLLMTKQHQLTAVAPLKYILADSPIYAIGQFFSFFALTTSFLGVTLGLMDFMSDALQVAKEGSKKLWLAALIFVPPIVITLINPKLFLTALGYAGGVGCALLLGLMPALMTWIGRYKLDYPTIHKQLPGGKKLLLVLMAFVVFEVGIELINELF